MNDLGLYEEARPTIRNGDIVNWQVDSLVGSIIRLFDVDSHTSLVAVQDYEGMTDRVCIVEARKKTEFNRLSKRLENTHGRAYLLRLKSHWNPIRPYICGWCVEQIGTVYDYAGLFGNLFGRVSMDAKNFFCSELAWFACRKGAFRYAARVELPELVAQDIIAVSKMLKNKAPRPGDFRRMPMYEKPVRIL